ncbi:unnamed protein product [Hanseniaspora opuntiae]
MKFSTLATTAACASLISAEANLFQNSFENNNHELPSSKKGPQTDSIEKHHGQEKTSSKLHKAIDDLKNGAIHATEVITNQFKVGDNYAIRLIDHQKEGVSSKQQSVLDILEPNAKKYSGYLDILDEDKHFFFIFWQSRSDPENDPTVIFMNGGPGCATVGGSNFLGCWSSLH